MATNHTDVRKAFNRARQFKLVRQYRGYSQTQLAKNIKGLSQSNISQFEKFGNSISEDKLIEIMNFFNWPFSFLDVRMGSIEFIKKF